MTPDIKVGDKVTVLAIVKDLNNDLMTVKIEGCSKDLWLLKSRVINHYPKPPGPIEIGTRYRPKFPESYPFFGDKMTIVFADTESVLVDIISDFNDGREGRRTYRRSLFDSQFELDTDLS